MAHACSHADLKPWKSFQKPLFTVITQRIRTNISEDFWAPSTGLGSLYTSAYYGSYLFPMVPIWFLLFLSNSEYFPNWTVLIDKLRHIHMCVCKHTQRTFQGNQYYFKNHQYLLLVKCINRSFQLSKKDKYWNWNWI